ncbi:MAG TPA: C4-dicarboxylate transporter DcuC [Candidatus Avacidaminococcus intestinavium]|uniref:C4-dicarboxylate transporter DcuC n=1 Tax=Candidatus Avacidaminococcus intestinavium TaxID=2840684 RepID=A0A9D1SL38_9FIRM|nr:C4-dicarboxylate transporter DcuC [Candidatus Avacidaminococcus intestinavium]
MGLVVSLIVTFWVGFLIYKKYKAQPVLFFGGMILMFAAVILGYGQILPEKASTGLVLFDAYEFIKTTLSSNAGKLGLNIMSVGAFARYMDKIGASRALVRLTIKPLMALKSPYLVLSGTWIAGMLIGLCINSASGLAMLLMVTMFPILVGLGVSRLSATAAVATTLCFDWSPSDTGTILSAEMAGVDPVIYWTDYQVPIVLVAFVVVGVLHYLTQKYMDKRDGHIVQPMVVEQTNEEEDRAPGIYAILPIVPLALILSFSSLWITWIKVDIVNAMLIGLSVGMLFEYIRWRDGKKVFSDIQAFFDGLGMQMANVITLIVAGQTFAKGLMTMGTIDTIINSSHGWGFGPMSMMLVMVTIIAVSAVVMGSGNAPFFAFAALTPAVATKMGIAPVLMLLPMHFAASIARNCSPITAVIVVSSGMGGVSPFDLIKRTAIPMAGAMLCNIGMTFFYYYRG